MLNPIKAFKQYIAGELLVNAKDEFEKARINLLVNYCIVILLLTTPFIPVLYHKNLMPQLWINAIAISTLPLLFYIVKVKQNLRGAAILYVVVQFWTSVSHLYLSSFQLSVQSLLWQFLHVNFAFFVLGSGWGFLMAATTLSFLAFGAINEVSGLTYFNSGYAWDQLMSEHDLPNLVIPFFMNMYILHEFVRTRGMAEIEIQESKKRSEELLLNILPEETALELKEKGSADAKYYKEVTVLFADIKNFSGIASHTSPQDLVNELHQCFKAFDEVISKYQIEKIKTIGDAYLCASGIPVETPTHATQVVSAAREMLQAIQNRSTLAGGVRFEFRIGIHTGPIVAGVVGIKKFSYDIWGDTVNTASRMEQNSEAGKINVSQATYELIKEHFKTTYRGEIEAKNKGKLKMYFVE